MRGGRPERDGRSELQEKDHTSETRGRAGYDNYPRRRNNDYQTRYTDDVVRIQRPNVGGIQEDR